MSGRCPCYAKRLIFFSVGDEGHRRWMFNQAIRCRHIRERTEFKGKILDKKAIEELIVEFSSKYVFQMQMLSI